MSRDTGKYDPPRETSLPLYVGVGALAHDLGGRVDPLRFGGISFVPSLCCEDGPLESTPRCNTHARGSNNGISQSSFRIEDNGDV